MKYECAYTYKCRFLITITLKREVTCLKKLSNFIESLKRLIDYNIII